MAQLLEDLKRVFTKPNNALYQLILINVIIFVLLGIIMVISQVAGFPGFYELVHREFAIPAAFQSFIRRPWTIITYSFAHDLSGIFHILFNMLGLYWFGRLITEYIGSKKLVNLYVLGAIGGAVLYLLAHNLIPFYIPRSEVVVMVGASASVFAVATAAATLLPNYTFFLLFLGPVRIVYLVAIYIFISFLGTIGSNAGGELAHLGGALLGFIYIKQLRSGRDIGLPVSKTLDFIKGLFSRRKIKVSYTNKSRTAGNFAKNTTQRTKSEQEEIDIILDKISASGYESLTKEEKQKLFNASKK